MPAKSRFTRLDAFAKTVEDARIRTTSGGIVTIVSLLAILWLIWGEWVDYRRVVVLPELVVDKSRGERMEIHLNMTFPRLPCELLTMDVMDVSGEQQVGVNHGVTKVRLSSPAEGGRVVDVQDMELHKQTDNKHLDPNYCGECGGAPPPANAGKPGCCNTCDEVREAYAQKQWSFRKGQNIEQCDREGYAERLEAQRKEGCRIQGVVRVNKVIGNFHIAPGRSFTNGFVHMHDLENYLETVDRPLDERHTMAHEIHQLRFGPQIPDELSQRWQWTDHHHTNPLDGTKQDTPEPALNYMYFVKVVSTSYLPLGWNPSSSSLPGAGVDHDETPLGLHGLSADPNGAPSLETHQYSVTSHKRSVLGGNDAAEGHRERLHSQGGIPGVFFNYDISPMKVVNREARPKTFTGFLTGVCAIVGGTLTVAAAVDRGLYEGAMKVKKIHSS